MGKRKTRKRGKKGGYVEKAGERVCVWYGKKQEVKPKGNPCKNSDLISEGLAIDIYPIGINNVGMWKAPYTAGYIYDPDVNYPLSEVTEWYPTKFKDLSKLGPQTEDGRYNLYYVGHERKSGSKDSAGNEERYELLKHYNVNIKKNVNGVIEINAPKWNDDMFLTFGDPDTIMIKWGSRDIETHVGVFWIEKISEKQRRNTVGGRRKKRRRRTKKRSRKKRKRTKKRRRRR